MNSLPSVNELLALLDALKKNVHDFAAREEKPESEFSFATAPLPKRIAAFKTFFFLL